ncbi:GNAT family N-acetyltransferase [Sphingomonas oryzagri]
MTDLFDTIQTERCRISQLRECDARTLQAITDASVTSHVHFLPGPFTLADAQALIVGSDRHNRFLGIWDRSRENLRGVIGVHLTPGGEIEVGYWLSTGARGQGIATEVTNAVVRALAMLHPARRIIAQCRPDNRRSWALLERIGFIPTNRAGNRPGRVLLAWQAPADYRIDVC